MRNKQDEEVIEFFRIIESLEPQFQVQDLGAQRC